MCASQVVLSPVRVLSASSFDDMSKTAQIKDFRGETLNFGYVLLGP